MPTFSFPSQTHAFDSDTAFGPTYRSPAQQETLTYSVDDSFSTHLDPQQGTFHGAQPSSQVEPIEQQDVWKLVEQSPPMQETFKTWLSNTLRDQAKRKALFELKGHVAQSLIDRLHHYLSDPEFRVVADPWLLKHTVIALRKLCEVSMLYPTCYVLSGVQDISSKDGGGFCDIFQGRYEGQLICLKVVRLYQKSRIEDLLRAHAREAILWSQLDHPNIVPFHGIFYLERKERICLVSPWMENGDIVEYLERVPDAPRKLFVYDIANGLQYLHAQNIVHGDLKGRNVLIDDYQNACLADFGLSTIVTDGSLGFAKTTTSASGLTTRWASPELLEDDARPTLESDIWAFGCVCYEVLTGLTPFAGCSDIKALSKLMRGEVPAQLDNARLDSNHFLNEMLCELVGKCWSIEAKQRPRCLEILRQLEKDYGPRFGIPALRKPSHPRFRFKNSSLSNSVSTSTYDLNSRGVLYHDSEVTEERLLGQDMEFSAVYTPNQNVDMLFDILPSISQGPDLANEVDKERLLGPYMELSTGNTPSSNVDMLSPAFDLATEVAEERLLGPDMELSTGYTPSSNVDMFDVSPSVSQVFDLATEVAEERQQDESLPLYHSSANYPLDWQTGWSFDLPAPANGDSISSDSEAQNLSYIPSQSSDARSSIVSSLLPQGTTISAPPLIPQPESTVNPEPVSSEAGRPPNVTDALSYLDAVKIQYAERPEIYNQFLDIMKDFKNQKIDTLCVIDRIPKLFNDNPYLIQGLNTFLPAGYQIEVSGDQSDPKTITVTTPQGTISDHSCSTVNPEPVPLKASRPANVTDALSYLDTVKIQYTETPEIYNQFLDIMKDFKNQNIDILCVIDRILKLFNGNLYLIQGLNTFLPDGYEIEVSGDPPDPSTITVTTPQGTTTKSTDGTVISPRPPRDPQAIPVPGPGNPLLCPPFNKEQPKTKTELVKWIMESGPSLFVPAGSANDPDHYGPMVTSAGSTFPNIGKNDRNVEVLSAWRSIMSHRAIKDANIDINDLCNEFTARAKSDGTNIVMEPEALHEIIESFSSKNH